MSFFAERDRPRPPENDEKEEREHHNIKLAEVGIQQPPEISELLKSLTPGTEKLITQTLKVQEPPARPRRLSQEPGPSNDPRFTSHENSSSPGRHATRGQQARCKRSRAKKARPQARLPSKRKRSGSSDIETDRPSRPQAGPKRACHSPSPDSSLERSDLPLEQTRGRKWTGSFSISSESSQDLSHSARTPSKYSRPAKPKRRRPTRYASESSTSDQSCQSSSLSPMPKQKRQSKLKHNKHNNTKKDSLKLPPLPAPLPKKIRKCEYVDFDDLLSSALYAPSVFNPTTFEFDVSSRTKFALKATNLEKPRVMGLGNLA